MTLDFDPIDEAAANWRGAGWAAVGDDCRHLHHSSAPDPLRPDRRGARAGRPQLLSLRGAPLLSFTKEGELPLGKVGDRLQVHPASVTSTVNRLEADGLVARKPHPTDRRTTLAVLTRDGRRRVEQAAVALAEIEFGVAGLTGDGRRSVDAAILELRVAAGDSFAPPSQRR